MEILNYRPAKPRGRPSLFDPSYCRIGEAMCQLGAIDRELAVALGVTERTVNLWKVRHPEFKAALQAGKDVADERVEQALFQRATGYSYDSVEILADAGRVFRVDVVRHLPPNLTAQIFWLKNRRPADWNRNNPPEPVNGADLIETMKTDAPTFAPLPAS